MRPSPIQLMHLVYKKVAVAENTDLMNKKPSGLGFDFEGVRLKANLGTGIKSGQENDPRDFLIDLEISIDNKEGKPTPYVLNVAVLGIFKVLPSLPLEKRQDLLTVNGASILYGVIREMVLSLTSRFPSGPLTLPGMNFQDHVSSEALPPTKVLAPAKLAARSAGLRLRKRSPVS
jgi:preprotein translocase subunit SecB